MTLKYLCPSCRSIAHIDHYYLGATHFCRKCRIAMTIPSNKESTGFIVGNYILKKRCNEYALGTWWEACDIPLNRTVFVITTTFDAEKQVMPWVKRIREYTNALDYSLLLALGEDNDVFYAAFTAGEYVISTIEGLGRSPLSLDINEIQHTK